MSRREIVDFPIDPFLRDFTHAESMQVLAGGYNYQACQVLIRDAAEGILRPANVNDFTLDEDQVFASSLFLAVTDFDSTDSEIAFNLPVVERGQYRIDSLILPAGMMPETRIGNQTLIDLLRGQGMLGVVVENRSYVPEGDRG